jgi:protein tyrosine phosphatase (PTP) superfamily phosphohydrolase (DUF442 family)
MVAESAGLGYSHIPVVPGQIGESHARAFQKSFPKQAARCWPLQDGHARGH